MEPQRGFSKTFAFLLLAGAIVVGTGVILNATRVKAFDPRNDPPAIGFGIRDQRTTKLNAATQKADVPPGNGCSLYRSATRFRRQCVALLPVQPTLHNRTTPTNAAR
jgi:hypothetical protein